MSEETKKKISESTKGEKSWNFGKHKTDEHRKKLSIAKLKNPTYYWKGKHLSEETKRKISKSKIGKSYPVSEETKQKIRNTHLKNKKNCTPKLYKRIPVCQIDKKTEEIIKKWPSASIAAETLKINTCHIYSCCKHRIKSAYGFIWKYAID